MSESKNTPRQSEPAQGDDDTLPRPEIVSARDAWIGAEPARTFEVSVNHERSEWCVRLMEHGQVVAIGSGAAWETALAAALQVVGSG